MPNDNKTIEQPIQSAYNLFTEQTRLTLIEIIKANEGNEVFFLGILNEEGIVDYVDPLAFGNAKAVPVVSGLLRPGNVVIHNHPSGGVEPSEADISVAGSLALLNVGSYIIDNLCEEVYILVKAIPQPKAVLLDIDEVKSFLESDGQLSKKIDEYEYRSEQIKMTEETSNSFNNNLITLIEAGTGVGKSLAYLIPAVLWASRNKERIIISTNTINLQEQLLYKDIPLLQNNLGIPFTAVLIKGRNNYLCLRKLQLVKKEHRFFADAKLSESLQSVIEWAETTADGSKTDLSFIPPDEIWESVHAEPETCPRVKCPHFEKCFFYRARRLAAKAELVIANHHLVMADLAIRLETQNYASPTVLPPSKRIIFDEAHNLEDVGTAYFSIHFTKLGIERLISKLISTKAEKVGLLYLLDNLINSMVTSNPSPILTKIQNDLFQNIFPKCENLHNYIGVEFTNMVHAFSEYINTIKDSETDESLKLRITDDISSSSFFINEIKEPLLKISKEILNFISEVENVLKTINKLNENSVNELWNTSVEIKGIVSKLELTASKIISFLNPEKDFCRWFEYTASRRGKEPFLKFLTGPIYIDESMKKAVFDVNDTVLLTSATLTVKNNFNYLKKQLGLSEYQIWKKTKKNDTTKENMPQEKIKFLSEIKLNSPFNYEKNVFIGIPFDIPEPNQIDFWEKISDIIIKSIEISQGGSLVLFTSYNLMKKVYEKTKSEINLLGIKTFIQGEEHRHKLLNRFRKHISSVLFATASFWEGIDVKGESLRLLIITRLPFKVPTEPILQARSEDIQKKGGDPFTEMDVPSAVTKFRQGFGRLIRSKTDRGAVLILDKRTITKSYGSVFINSLPKCKMTVAETEHVLDDLRQFFS